MQHAGPCGGCGARASAGRRARRTGGRGRRSGAGVSRPRRSDRRRLLPRTRAGRSAGLSHRRHLPLARGRGAGIPRAARQPGEGARLPDRTRRDRGGAGRSAGRRGGGGGAFARSGRDTSGRLCRRCCAGPVRDFRCAAAPPAPAHGAGAASAPARPAGHGERQAGPGGPARPAAQHRYDRRGRAASDLDRGGACGDLARDPGDRDDCPERRVLRPRRAFAAGGAAVRPHRGPVRRGSSDLDAVCLSDHRGPFAVDRDTAGGAVVRS